MNLIEEIFKRYLQKYTILSLAPFVVISTIFLMLVDIYIQDKFRIEFLSEKDLKITDGILYPFFLFVLLIVLVTVLLIMWEKIKHHKRIMFSKKELALMPLISKWNFQGSLKIDGELLAITSSDLGCLIKDNLYKNFVMSFNAKIINGGRLGIIFRGQDLENYLMLQVELCDCNGSRIYDIVPYVRVWGDLESFRPHFRLGEGFLHKYKKLRNKDIEKDNEKLLYDLENGLLVNLIVKDTTAIVKITSYGEEKKFCWDIPTHTKPNIISLKKDNSNESNEKDEPIFPEQKSASIIWFRNKSGKIGFRADNLEKAIISNLKIQKI